MLLKNLFLTTIIPQKLSAVKQKKTFFFIFIFYLFESFGTGNAFKISFSYYHYSTKPFR